MSRSKAEYKLMQREKARTSGLIRKLYLTRRFCCDCGKRLDKDLFLDDRPTLVKRNGEHVLACRCCHRLNGGGA